VAAFAGPAAVPVQGFAAPGNTIEETAASATGGTVTELAGSALLCHVEHEAHVRFHVIMWSSDALDPLRGTDPSTVAQQRPAKNPLFASNDGEAETGESHLNKMRQEQEIMRGEALKLRGRAETSRRRARERHPDRSKEQV